MRQPYEKKLFETKLATVPEVLRADTAVAVATPAKKRNAVQAYLADKLGPGLRVRPEEVTRSLGDASVPGWKAKDSGPWSPRTVARR